MKKEELPQDKGAIVDLCYVKNKSGKYETQKSTGWEVKIAALDSAWDEVDRRVEDARIEVKEGRKSPVFYYMEKNLMDVQTLAAYVDFWSFTVKRHFKPSVFKKLSQKRLEKYAEVFEISVEELIKFKAQ